MKVYRSKELPQRTRRWFDARCGRICSSEVGAVIANDGTLRRSRDKRGYSDAVHTYVNKIVGERISGYVAISDYASTDMQYGSAHEHAATEMLSLITDVEFEPIGGVMSDDLQLWASSDGVSFGAGDSINAVAEIKIPTPKIMVKYLLDELEFMADYKAQVAHEIIVTGADVGYLFAYGAGLRLSRSNVLIPIEASCEYVRNMRKSLGELVALVDTALEKLGASLIPPKAPMTAAESQADIDAWVRSVTAA